MYTVLKNGLSALFISLLCTTAADLFAEDAAPKQEQPSKKKLCDTFLGVRHMGSRGIGYNNGYTTLTGLLFPGMQKNTSFFPLVDFRFHEFDNNKQAANGGFGVRYLSSHFHKVFGINSFYDYRKSHHGPYNQIGLGLEMLGERFDLRLNGYLPVGEKEHDIQHCLFTHYTHGYWIKKEREEVALKAANLELGALLYRCRNASFYAALGPYYLNGDICRRDAWGVEGRVSLMAYRYIFIEGHISHDCLFETRAQGIIGLNFPIGCCRAKNPSHTKRLLKEEVLSLPIERHEIIPLFRKCEWEWNY